MEVPVNPPHTELAAPAQRRFVLAFLGTTLLGLTTIAALNVLADPYGAFGITLIPADSRTGDSRTARGEMLRRFTGETVLIGSSRTRVAYDGSLACIPGGPACNVGLDGTHLEELALVVEAAAENPRVRRIVLSLDLHLGARDWQPNADYHCSRFNPQRSELEHWCDLLWNGRTIEASLRAVRRSWRGVEPLHDVRGFARGAAVKFESATQATRTTATLTRFCGSGGVLANLQPLDETRRQIAGMLTVCQRRGIDVMIVIDPVHALLLEGLRQQGNWAAYQAWKETVVSLAQQHGVPVWDFTGYSTWTTEPLLGESQPASQWFWEPSHMRRELGDRVLQRVFGDPAADTNFGRVLTRETLAEHWVSVEVSRRRWLADDATESALLAQALAPQSDSIPAARVAKESQAGVMR